MAETIDRVGRLMSLIGKAGDEFIQYKADPSPERMATYLETTSQLLGALTAEVCVNMIQTGCKRERSARVFGGRCLDG